MTQATECDFCGTCPAEFTDTLTLNADLTPYDHSGRRYRCWDICRDCLRTIISTNLTTDAASRLQPLLKFPPK